VTFLINFTICEIYSLFNIHVYRFLYLPTRKYLSLNIEPFYLITNIIIIIFFIKEENLDDVTIGLFYLSIYLSLK